MSWTNWTSSPFWCLVLSSGYFGPVKQSAYQLSEIHVPDPMSTTGPSGTATGVELRPAEEACGSSCGSGPSRPNIPNATPRPTQMQATTSIEEIIKNNVRRVMADLSLCRRRPDYAG